MNLFIDLLQGPRLESMISVHQTCGSEVVQLGGVARICHVSSRFDSCYTSNLATVQNIRAKLVDFDLNQNQLWRKPGCRIVDRIDPALPHIGPRCVEALKTSASRTVTRAIDKANHSPLYREPHICEAQGWSNCHRYHLSIL
jgi:hypothetical protein